MITLQQLAKYCRDYIDLVSPSLLSRDAKKVLIPKEILDATPLYTQTEGVDYESLTLQLSLAALLKDLESDEDASEDDEDSEEDSDEKLLSDEEESNLHIAKTLDEISRKYETSSYTKQVTLRFGRVNFRAEPIPSATSDEKPEGFKDVEQHLFSVPVTINFKDSGGARHYSLVVDDTFITTNIKFLNEFLPQASREELFRFISKSEVNELTTIPANFEYVDELWAKIKHYLELAGARGISEAPDMENTLVILLPKANYFLSQDLAGIIDAADDEELLSTSLSAWVDDTDLSVNESVSDSGSQELFFPFPYDKYQLQVLGKLGNRAAVVEGPPGTGKSQTIANILCHLAATGKKVLFVSQKDQAIRGVKDKLRDLDIPYLYGYLPDRASRLHTEQDERDSAANALKGLENLGYLQAEKAVDPLISLKSLSDEVPAFDLNIERQRGYFNLHNEFTSLDKYDFGTDAPRITEDWLKQIDELTTDVLEKGSLKQRLEQAIEGLKGRLSALAESSENIAKKSIVLSKRFYSQTNYEWLTNEANLLRGLTFQDVVLSMQSLIERFDECVPDRKTNFIQTAYNNAKLSKELNQSIEKLPREMYDSLRTIVFDNSQTKTNRFMTLENIRMYFESKANCDSEISKYNSAHVVAAQTFESQADELEEVESALSASRNSLIEMTLDDISMERVRGLYEQDGSKAFLAIKRRYELGVELREYEALNINNISEAIMHQKQTYKSSIRSYIKNRLITQVHALNQQRNYRSTLQSVSRKLSKTKKAYKTFDALRSNPKNFEAMSAIIPVWMMGLDDASRVLPLAPNLFDYVIIDEASQCNISYALPAMYRAKHAILFGDTLQMRDTTTAFKSNDVLQALASKHSIPEDLQIKADEDSVKSVMDIAKLAGFQTSVLRNHYRSPKELIGFSNRWFYEPKNRKLQVINDDILTMEDGRVLKNHVIQPDTSYETSTKTNLSEAFYIKQLVENIKSDPQTRDKSIAVLTFFNEQAELLRRVITDEDVKVSVIEGIQGDERDIVIYSFVIKSPEDKPRYVSLTGEGGELRKEINEGRVNVAFSRARLQVHAVTSLQPAHWPEGIWIKRYLQYVEEYGRVSRKPKAEQSFDSKFEANVYDFLFNELNVDTYNLTTQYPSCGFKIDLVIRNNKTGKRLAIECDGPTHFEDGDGQVRVSGDWERLEVLGTAKWEFCHVLYRDWIEDQASAKQELLEFITDYFKGTKSRTKSAVSRPSEPTPIYTPTPVMIPQSLVDTLKEEAKKATEKRGPFGRKKVSPEAEAPTPVTSPAMPEKSKSEIAENPAQTAEPTKFTDVDKEHDTQAFSELTTVKLSERRSLVISRTPDESIWVNEKLNTEKYKGFTSKGFGIPVGELEQFVAAISEAIANVEYEKEFIKSEELKLVVHNAEAGTVDIRYYKTSPGYTGYLKKGIRVIKPSAEKLRNALQEISLKHLR